MQPLIEIRAAERIDDEIVAALSHLLPQINPSLPLPDRAQLSAIVESDCGSLLLARRRDNQGIVGMAAVIVYRVPSGVRAVIEDVVVDNAARGYGVGEALMREAMARAAKRGATAVDLTSHAGRQAANCLYRKLGFQVRQTNPYRCPLASQQTTEAGSTD